MSSLCPAIDSFARDSPTDFEGACAWIVRQHNAPGPAVIVTHREGIRQLAADRHLRLPYCAIAKFEACITCENGAAPIWRLIALKEDV